jgi:hypothetical protein
LLVANSAGVVSLVCRSEARGRAVVRCQLCSYQASRGGQLRAHMKTEHGPAAACTKCEYVGVTAAHLKQHRRDHHQVVKLACTYCTYRCDGLSLQQRIFFIMLFSKAELLHFSEYLGRILYFGPTTVCPSPRSQPLRWFFKIPHTISG